MPVGYPSLFKRITPPPARHLQQRSPKGAAPPFGAGAGGGMGELDPSDVEIEGGGAPGARFGGVEGANLLPSEMSSEGGGPLRGWAEHSSFKRWMSMQRLPFSWTRVHTHIFPNEELLDSIWLCLGPASFATFAWLAPPLNPEQPSVSRMAGVLSWMATWWISEAAPLPITSLLPVVLLPMLGIMSSEQVSGHYMGDTLMLFVGSFIVAIAIERWDLHRRVALWVLLQVGVEPRRLLLGFILSTGLLSMWISNAACSVMMVPMAVAALESITGAGGGFGGEAGEGLGGSQRGRRGGGGGPGRARVAPSSASSSRGGALGDVEMIGQGGGGGVAPGRVRGRSPRRADSTLDELVPVLGRAGGRSTSSAPDDEDDGGGGSSEAGGDGLAPTPRPRGGGGGAGPAGVDGLHPAVRRYFQGVILAIAYAASIGGMSTLTGTGPNLVFSGLWKELHPEEPPISFGKWFAFAFPLSCVFLLCLWGIFCTWYCKGLDARMLDTGSLKAQYESLGPMSRAEKVLAIDFVGMAALWLTRDPELGGWGRLFASGARVSDGAAAVAAAIVLFLVPAHARSTGRRERVMDWRTASALPWDVVLLMGGGFALSAGIRASGLFAWVGSRLQSLAALPPGLLPMAIAATVTVVTEFTSNTATATIFIPLISEAAAQIGRPPMLLLLPTCLACSLSFMLPNATPPNAVAHSTGLLRVRDMVFPGLVMNLVGVALVAVAVPTWGAYVFGFDLEREGGEVEGGGRNGGRGE